MRRWKIYVLTTTFLLLVQYSIGQIDTARIKKSAKPNYTNEFFPSVGYNYCRYNFIDVGLRYYHWKNDGQTIMAFAGPAVGCEFSFDQAEQIYIPYIGWQGQVFGLGYGLRAEYAITSKKQSFGFTPELGLSLFEFLRITGGYRVSLYNMDPFTLNGFRFSLIASYPLSMMKSD